ncbi:N-acetylmuramoyl-L-alanine amidase [Oscillatoria sp. FACHB-1406]|uniref:N-acetylmuramoyl-L-alanine amidase family protein n=1 Tax=Oscillatoria sp. FACHB-1406 TaxID=2692846 RepID=UPI0016860CE0|nr:N-acetylmuramoyl-L-alanine amidase [Oscillatoria sp. FACHB-1406]MBD2577418.1 N-acetylmuramoyl-L-alanine amidase [Oscillatoria sp. FACHB-1406]
MKLFWGLLGLLSLSLLTPTANAQELLTEHAGEERNPTSLDATESALPDKQRLISEATESSALIRVQISELNSGASDFTEIESIESARSQEPSSIPDNPDLAQRPEFDSGDRDLIEIESIEVGITGLQLLIKSNGAIRFQSQRLSGGVQQILIRNARLGSSASAPTASGRYISRLRVQQLDSRTVVLFVEPRAGYEVGDISQRSERLLTVDLREIRVSPIPSPRVPSPPVRPGQPPTVGPPTLPRGRILIAIDPGHGGQDPGAIGINGLQEKDVILPISLEVQRLLEQQGVSVLMTRSSDYFVSLEERARMANSDRASLFVSIHANAVNRSNVSGVETYYLSSGRGLAETVQSSIIQTTNARNRGVKQARFYVLRNTSMPSILIEVGFVTGVEDAARLANPNYQSQMAAAIAQGILRYIQQSRP